MLIFCGEDIGLADPQALVVTVAAAEAFDRVGMPEGRYHLGMATLYLATAPKSNSVMGFFDALSTVEHEREGEVPNHLRDASRDKEGFGHGEGYLYPHAYRDHWIAQQYLPDELQGKLFYTPGRLGYENGVADEVLRRREAQLAAALDPGADAPAEILTFSPKDGAFNRWLDRTVGDTGQQLGMLRDALSEQIPWQRHDVVLVLNAGNGLFAAEAMRRVPEGGVWTLTFDERAARTLDGIIGQCPDLRKPTVLIGLPDDVRQTIAQHCADDLRFDRVVGRNVCGRVTDRPTFWRDLTELLRENGTVGVVETLVQHTQRLYKLVDCSALSGNVSELLEQAEEHIYADPTNGSVNWDDTDFIRWTESAGLETVHVETREHTGHRLIGSELVDRWFTAGQSGGTPTYRDRLAQLLSDEQINAVRRCYVRTFAAGPVPWRTTTLIYTGRKR